MIKVSIVTTLYHSEKYINEFYNRSLETLKRINIENYEIIFVNDGSPDHSLQKALELFHQNPKVVVIDLSRNFGHHKAIMTGLSHSKGDYVFLIDADLEESPELLESFWNEINKNENTDVIYGIQKKRKGGLLERISGAIFYKIFNWFSKDSKIENNFLTVRLMKKEYVQEITKFQEQEFYFAPICSLTGFNQKSIFVKKTSTSPTTYSFLRKYNMLINSVFSFSPKPLFFIFYFGFFLTMLSFSFGLYILLRKLIFDIVADGWTSIMASIWFLGGIIILFLGIIAIYISKIFVETKKRPFTSIKKIWEEK